MTMIHLLPLYPSNAPPPLYPMPHHAPHMHPHMLPSPSRRLTLLFDSEGMTFLIFFDMSYTVFDIDLNI
jgi:hypothetical protein